MIGISTTLITIVNVLTTGQTYSITVKYRFIDILIYINCRK